MALIFHVVQVFHLVSNESHAGNETGSLMIQGRKSIMEG